MSDHYLRSVGTALITALTLKVLDSGSDDAQPSSAPAATPATPTILTSFTNRVAAVNAALALRVEFMTRAAAARSAAIASGGNFNLATYSAEDPFYARVAAVLGDAEFGTVDLVDMAPARALYLQLLDTVCSTAVGVDLRVTAADLDACLLLIDDLATGLLAQVASLTATISVVSSPVVDGAPMPIQH